MGTRASRLLGASLACTLLAACAGAPSRYTGSGYAPRSAADAPRRTTSATILSGDDIFRHGGTVLSALRHRVAGMQVRQSRGVCPEITLRGQKTVFTSSSPQVYVNGTAAMDTCILEMTQASDVERVEVYPQGVAGRPGYPSYPYGLILVFLRKA